MSFYRWDGEDLILDCHLQPKASKDEFAGLHGDRLKIRLTAPPVEGKANAHLQTFLAKAFGVAKSQVSLESSELNRHTRLRIQRFPGCSAPDDHSAAIPDHKAVLCKQPIDGRLVPRIMQVIPANAVLPGGKAN